MNGRGSNGAWGWWGGWLLGSCTFLAIVHVRTPRTSCTNNASSPRHHPHPRAAAPRSFVRVFAFTQHA